MPYSLVNSGQGIPKRVKALLFVSCLLPIVPIYFGGFQITSLVMAFALLFVPAKLYLRWAMGLSNKLICPNCRSERRGYESGEVSNFDIKDLPLEIREKIGRLTVNRAGQEVVIVEDKYRMYLCDGCRSYEIEELV